jgi:hypothetical protein
VVGIRRLRRRRKMFLEVNNAVIYVQCSETA